MNEIAKGALTLGTYALATYVGWQIGTQTMARRVDPPWSIKERISKIIAALAVQTILVYQALNLVAPSLSSWKFLSGLFWVNIEQGFLGFALAEILRTNHPIPPPRIFRLFNPPLQLFNVFVQRFDEVPIRNRYKEIWRRERQRRRLG